MSKIKTRIAKIDLGGTPYPIVCDLNTMDDVEERFDKGFYEIISMLGSGKGTFAVLRALIAIFVNEGLEVAKENGEFLELEKVDERFVGRKIAPENMERIMNIVMDTVSESLPEDEEDDENPQMGQV